MLLQHHNTLVIQYWKHPLRLNASVSILRSTSYLPAAYVICCCTAYIFTTDFLSFGLFVFIGYDFITRKLSKWSWQVL